MEQPKITTVYGFNQNQEYKRISPVYFNIGAWEMFWKESGTANLSLLIAVLKEKLNDT